MSYRNLMGCVEWTLMVGLVFGAGAMARAQQAPQQDDGRVVQIGRADAGEGTPSVPPPQGQGAGDQAGAAGVEQLGVSKYWIGLRGGVIGDDDPLRAHVDLPADVGLLVVEIVPDGPAAKAGLKKYDILLRANDADLHQMTELIELVGTEGAKKGQIAVDILRHGDRETVYITPEERPASAQQPLGGEMGNGMGMTGELLGQLQGRGPMFQFRNFGPGVIIGGQGLTSIPNGVAVSIQKEAGKPTQITVKRGDESWEVVGDDAESLKKLPEDLRPFVEQMLQGDALFGGGARMPNLNLRMPNFDRLNRPGFDDEQLRQRLDLMERQMNELLERLGKGEPADAPPQAEQEETK